MVVVIVPIYVEILVAEIVFRVDFIVDVYHKEVYQIHVDLMVGVYDDD